MRGSSSRKALFGASKPSGEYMTDFGSDVHRRLRVDSIHRIAINRQLFVNANPISNPQSGSYPKPHQTVHPRPSDPFNHRIHQSPRRH